ncbi:hypothetical protein [Campylobacter concisus]|uniref:hypothetical protein n=1 Tax=Campylobacter concisus TaxID=199 RepID=UPI00165F813F|nr:hypothetical protein [Campylobacter concisus]
MPSKKMLLNDLKAIRKNKTKQEIKQACIEVLFPNGEKSMRQQMSINPLMHAIFSYPKNTKKKMRS